jgi:hypothetical protein
MERYWVGVGSQRPGIILQPSDSVAEEEINDLTIPQFQ